jgi:hypothetical protein
MSSQPAQPDELDSCTWIFNRMVISRKLYDIANTRGDALPYWHRKMVNSGHLVKPGWVFRDCHGLIPLRFC